MFSYSNDLIRYLIFLIHTAFQLVSQTQSIKITDFPFSLDYFLKKRT